MNEWLVAALEARARHAALIVGAEILTYEQLVDRVLRVATVLRSHGLTRGKRVGIAMDNSADFVTTLLGIVAGGGTATLVNPQYKNWELRYLFAANDLGAVVADSGCVARCRQALDQEGLDAEVLAYADTEGAIDIHSDVRTAALSEFASVAPADTMVTLNTSGSTGRAKVVPRTHGQLLAECDAFASAAQISPDDVFFAAVPLYHSHGLLDCLLASLRSHSALVLFDTRMPIALARADAVKALEKHAVTIVPGVPYLFDALAAIKEPPALPALRLCFTGGSPLEKKTYDEFTGRYGVPVRQHYGSTETGGIALNLSANPAETWNTVGRAFPGVEVTRLDSLGDAAGEIGVKSRAVCAGYEGEPHVNREVFVDGWFRTGDTGVIDDRGYITITGRRPLYLEVAGHKIDPREIEDVLHAHPAVREAVVPGLDRRTGGLKAVVVADGVEPEELRRFTKEHLAPYKVPTVIELRDEIPRNAAGKLLRKDLL